MAMIAQVFGNRLNSHVRMTGGTDDPDFIKYLQKYRVIWFVIENQRRNPYKVSLLYIN